MPYSLVAEGKSSFLYTLALCGTPYISIFEALPLVDYNFFSHHHVHSEYQSPFLFTRDFILHIFSAICIFPTLATTSGLPGTQRVKREIGKKSIQLLRVSTWQFHYEITMR
jgi:hypothetical protein